MADKPLVKVVLTTFNRRDWAELAIESILAQTYRPIHLVIVDDASSDGTPELCHRYAEMHPDIISVVAKSENRGVADTIRRGIAAPPHADYVAFLNDDDLWMPEKLEQQVELFASSPDATLTYCEAEIFDEHGNSDGRLHSDAAGRYARGDFAEALDRNGVCASAIMMPSELAERVGPMLPDRSEAWDYYFVLAAAAQGSVRMVPTKLARYRLASSGNVSIERESDVTRDAIIARELVFQLFPELEQRFGGPAGVRRQLGLHALNAALWEVRNRRWGAYLWHAKFILRQRQPRLAVWLSIHSVRGLLNPVRTAPRQSTA